MSKRTTKILASSLSAALVASMVTLPSVASAATSTQLAGLNRYETSLEIVQAGWDSSDNVIIASGESRNMADSLAAAPLAYKMGEAPILLTKTDSIPAGVLEELTSLGVKTITIVGGDNAVSPAVEAELKATGVTVERVFGADRFETSLAIAKAAFGTDATNVVIANGLASADALSVSSIAAYEGMPVLLVNNKTGLTAEQKAYIAGTTVYAVGGTTVLSNEVVGNATRLSGDNRYETNAAILEKFAPDYSKIFLAKGTEANLVDALVGSAYAAKGNNPIVLVDAQDAINAKLITELTKNISANSEIVRLGGKVTTSAADAVEAVKAQDLAVKSVSAINLKQVEVTFNTAVGMDAEDVTDVANYNFKDADDAEIAAADVEVVGNKAIVTLESAVANQGATTITIDKIVTGTEFTKEVEFLDFTIPEVASASVVGSKTIKVKFSEPINTDVNNDGNVDADLKDAFELNNGSQFVKAVTFLNNNTEANVEFYTDLEVGMQTISITNGLEDYAGYSVIAKDIEVDVVLDETAPVIVSVKDVTPTKATLVFDEDLVDQTLTVGDFYHTNTGEVAATAKVVNGNEIELTFAVGDELPNGTAYIYVAKEAIVDLWGNENTQQLRISVVVTIDETAPVVEKVEASAQNELEVTFNEDVDSSTGDFTLLDEDGEELNIVGNVSYLQKDSKDVKNTLVIALDDKIYGDHSLVVEDVEDGYGNALKSSTTKFVVADETAPKFTDFSSTLYKDDEATEILVVDFDEEMSVTGTNSVLDLEKYIINDKALADFDSAKIIATNKNTKVRIEVKSSELNMSAAVNGLEIARVADAAGNKTAGLAGLVDIDISSTVDVDTVEATANNKIKVTLKDLVTDFDEKDFDLITASSVNLRDVDNDVNTADSLVVGASIDNSGKASVITFTLADDTMIDAGYYTGTTDKVVVSTVAQNLVSTINSFGEKVEFTASAEDKIAGGILEYTVGTDNEVDKVLAEQGSVTLYFTEDLDDQTISALSFEVAGEEIVAVNQALGNNSLTLVLEDTTVLADVGTKVTQKAAVKDQNGNKIEAIATKVSEAADTVKPTLVTSVEDTTTQVTLTFSEALDASTVTVGNFASTATTSAVSLSNDGKTVVVTVGTMSATETITVGAAVKDLADNAITPVTLTRGTEF